MAGTCNWDGYTFSVHDLSTDGWNDIPGIYIFAYVTSPNTWQAVYIGETGSLQTRLPGHERLDEAILAGATNIHAMPIQGWSEGRRGETDPEVQPGPATLAPDQPSGNRPR